jgi:hypothetical protein
MNAPPKIIRAIGCDPQDLEQQVSTQPASRQAAYLLVAQEISCFKIMHL